MPTLERLKAVGGVFFQKDAKWCILLVNECMNRISGVMVCMLVSRAVNRGFKPRSCLTKDYKIGNSTSPDLQSLYEKYQL
jgi:hypothetical protein